MAQIVSESVLVPHIVLRDFGAGCLQHVGVSTEHAQLVANALVESNLRGIDSHGIARLTHYLNRIRGGSINVRPELKFTQISPALGRVDGDHGLGQIVMQRATTEAISLARAAGAGWVAVEKSTHCGALAFYGLQLAKANMIGILFTHSDSFVVPYAAKKPFCGTNPICITAPGEDGTSLCLDMATSIVPWNTIMNAATEDVPVPAHWGVDANGEASTDPKLIKAVRPFGDFKGSGLGLMIDVLCSFLLGSPCGPDISAMYGDPSAKRFLGGLVGAIDVSHFGSAEAFHQRISDVMRRWNEQQRADPAVPVLYPGQPEMITHAQRLIDGIPIGLKLREVFRQIAVELDTPFPV